MRNIHENLTHPQYSAVKGAANKPYGDGFNADASAALREYLDGVIPPELWAKARQLRERIGSPEARSAVEDQIDALASAMAFAGLDRGLIADVSAADVSVLSTLVPHPTEPSLIEHDLRNFRGMRGRPAYEHTPTSSPTVVTGSM